VWTSEHTVKGLVVRFPFILSAQVWLIVWYDLGKQEPQLYDLLANVTHESTAGTTRDRENTVWKVALRVASPSSNSSNSTEEEAAEKWIQIQDLIVEDIQKEMIFLGEVVLQVWERRGAGKTSLAELERIVKGEGGAKRKVEKVNGKK
jgi:hypothetical protein